jgi:uncharacterized membrane protein
MTATTDRAVDEYLRRLERSLRDLSRQRRREIVAEIEEHLADTLAEMGPAAGEAAVRNALDRVGDPDDIAAEARERFGIRSGRPSWTDPLAIVLLLIGGFLWLVGWIAGIVLLWLSDVWSVRDKIIGTLLVPGGLLAPTWLLLLGGGVRSAACFTDRRADGVVVTSCDAGGGGIDVLAVVLLAFLVMAPIATAVYLGRKLRRARLDGR